MSPNAASLAVSPERLNAAEAIEVIRHRVRCIRLPAVAAEKQPRFLFNPAATNRSIAAIATEKKAAKPVG